MRLPKDAGVDLRAVVSILYEADGLCDVRELAQDLALALVSILYEADGLCDFLPSICSGTTLCRFNPLRG